MRLSQVVRFVVGLDILNLTKVWSSSRLILKLIHLINTFFFLLVTTDSSDCSFASIFFAITSNAKLHTHYFVACLVITFNLINLLEVRFQVESICTTSVMRYCEPDEML